MKILSDLIKSKSDKNSYLALELANQLKVILIHSTNKTAGASLTVNRGSSSDPLDFQGIAHFLEHMLFISSQKFPQIDYYRNVVNKYNGKCNAFTMFDKTSFYFEVNQEGLMETLEVFSQFFVSSTFNQQYVEKEILAVNSEHNKNLASNVHKEY